MHDRETLILAIEMRERIAKRNHQGFVDFPYEMVGKVLNLLKEQEAVARCKDCEHCYFASNRIQIEQTFACGKHGIDVTPDWFCADGERKEGR